MTELDWTPLFFLSASFFYIFGFLINHIWSEEPEQPSTPSGPLNSSPALHWAERGESLPDVAVKNGCIVKDDAVASFSHSLNCRRPFTSHTLTQSPSPPREPMMMIPDLFCRIDPPVTSQAPLACSLTESSAYVRSVARGSRPTRCLVSRSRAFLSSTQYLTPPFFLKKNSFVFAIFKSGSTYGFQRSSCASFGATPGVVQRTAEQRCLVALPRECESLLVVLLDARCFWAPSSPVPLSSKSCLMWGFFSLPDAAAHCLCDSD